MIDNELQKVLDAAKMKTVFTDISEEWLIDMVHSALSFENPTLTKTEVEEILNHDMSKVASVTSEKVQAVINQKQAFNKILEMVKNNEELDENKLKDIHQLLAQGTCVIGGLYRNVNISVKGSNHTPCSHEKVYDRMRKYIDFLSTKPQGDIFEYIAYSHLQLAKIHPFLDCNGRLARMVLNYELMKHGYMPIIITYKDRDKYLNTLEKFKVEKNITPFIEFLKTLELQSLKAVL